MMEICSCCGLEKDENEFYPRRIKENINRKRVIKKRKCKECIFEYNKEYQSNNKEKIAATKKSYYKNNRESVLEKRKQYGKEHKEERAAYAKIYAQEHKEEISEYNKGYRRKNKKKILENNKIYKRKQRKENPIFRLRNSISRMIYQMLKTNKDGSSFLEYVPYTLDDLKDNIESKFTNWMTWENQGVYLVDDWNDDDPSTWTWQLDHIIPHSTFTYDTMDCEEFRACWALSNLRPYSAKQNVIDNNRRNGKE